MVATQRDVDRDGVGNGSKCPHGDDRDRIFSCRKVSLGSFDGSHGGGGINMPGPAGMGWP